MFNLLVILFAIQTSLFAHEGHHHRHEETIELYKQVFYDFNVAPSPSETVNDLSYSYIRNGQDFIKLPESSLSLLVREQVRLYEDIIQQQCHCDISELKRENEKRIPFIIRKVKTFFPKILTEINKMLWEEVSGLRRYGPVYVIISIIGEIVDHNISPVPLCKFVACFARIASDKLNTLKSLTAPYYKGINTIDRFKALYSRMVYKKKYKAHWEKLYFRAFEELPFPKKEVSQGKNNNNFLFLAKRDKNLNQMTIDEIRLAFSTLDTMKKMWFIDQIIDSFNFTYYFLKDQGYRLKKEKNIDKKNYFKLQWDLGSYGVKIDLLKIRLYAASSSKDPENYDYSKIEKQIQLIEENFKQYQALFLEVDHQWKEGHQMFLGKEMKKIVLEEKSCRSFVDYIYNWKFWAIPTGLYLAYNIMDDEFKRVEVVVENFSKKILNKLHSLEK